jgi:hypothetical protein
MINRKFMDFIGMIVVIIGYAEIYELQTLIKHKK